MTRPARGPSLSVLDPREARADPAHRLWFDFVDALERAKAAQTRDAFDQAHTAWCAFYADFTQNPAHPGTETRT